MSNYHGQIMNHQVNRFAVDQLATDENMPTDPIELLQVVSLAYKIGHRDARHAAAEIAAEADTRIAELERQIDLQAKLHSVTVAELSAQLEAALAGATPTQLTTEKTK